MRREEDVAVPAKILIVDDIEANRNLLSDFAVMLGHVPTLAVDGSSAVDQMTSDAPDLVLLDILMPGMDGYEVLEHMKNDTTLRHLPVIMISAVDEMESVVRCIERGADDYLLKPFNPTLLKARVTACLEKKHLRDREQELHRELAESFEALQKAEEARDGLFHMIVHDLKNPLMGVMGFADLAMRGLSRESVDKEKLLKHLQYIHNGGTEMSSLIKGILDVSKLEAGEMTVSLSSVDAVELSKTICEQFRAPAERVGMHLSSQAEMDTAMVRADKELLTRILQNLLSNALKYAGKGANVICSVRSEGDSAILGVEDNGPGIPAECKNKVFEKFFQVADGPAKPKYGVGLGLAFCRMAAEAQGGKIWVESEEGKGTKFKVELKRGDMT